MSFIDKIIRNILCLLGKKDEDSNHPPSNPVEQSIKVDKQGKQEIYYFEELIIENEKAVSKSEFINIAKKLYEPRLKDTLIPEDNVKICPCDGRVALISSDSWPDGVLHPGGSHNSNGNGSNDGNTNFAHLVPNYQHLIDICKKALGKSNLVSCDFPDRTNESITVAFLDTSLDGDLLYSLCHISNINTNNISLEQIDCTKNNTTDTAHGTGVAITFLKKFYSITANKNKKIHLQIYNVTRMTKEGLAVPLFQVLCALYNIIHDGTVKYINMSLGFPKEIPIVYKLIKRHLNHIPITCSAGNDGLDITHGNSDEHGNFPSGYARDYFSKSVIKHEPDYWESNPIQLKNIIEVFGLPNVSGPHKGVWRNYSSSRPSPTEKMESNRMGNTHPTNVTTLDDAVFDRGINNFDGGTSFAAPRALAKIIT